MIVLAIFSFVFASISFVSMGSFSVSPSRGGIHSPKLLFSCFLFFFAVYFCHLLSMVWNGWLSWWLVPLSSLVCFHCFLVSWYLVRDRLFLVVFFLLFGVYLSFVWKACFHSWTCFGIAYSLLCLMFSHILFLSVSQYFVWNFLFLAGLPFRFVQLMFQISLFAFGRNSTRVLQITVTWSDDGMQLRYYFEELLFCKCSV